MEPETMREVPEQSPSKTAVLDPTKPESFRPRPRTLKNADSFQSCCSVPGSSPAGKTAQGADNPSTQVPEVDVPLAGLKARGPGAIQAFQTALSEGKQNLQTVKLFFVGPATSGKTSTLSALAGQSFDQKQPPTHGWATCTLKAELLQTQAMRKAPWEMTKGTRTVSELLEQGVVRTVSKKLAVDCPHLDSSAEELQASIEHSLSETYANTLLPQTALKMPVDLIARSLSTDRAEEDNAIVMQTWDFAGEQMYDTMAHVWLTALGIYVLVLDMSAWSSHIQGEASELSADQMESIDFWLAAILVHAPDARLMIVGTHEDEVPDAVRPLVHSAVDQHIAERLDKNPALHDHLHVNEAAQLLFFPVDNTRSTSTGQESINSLRTALNDLALKTANEMLQIPTKWAHFYYVLTNGLETQEDSSKKPFYLTLDEMRQKATAFDMEKHDDLDAFLTLFHSMGLLLHFPGSPAVVLEPQWLCDAMANIVGCPRIVQKHSHHAAALRDKGELNADLLGSLWSDTQFQGHHTTLQAFLEHFDVIVPGISNKADWIVPSLLPRQKTLPKKSGSQATTAFLIDFKGTLCSLLSSLLPRILCYLKRREGANLRVVSVCQDSMKFALTDTKLMISMDMLPAQAPQLVRVTTSSPGGAALTAKDAKALLRAISDGIHAWLPRLSFSAKVPCPVCVDGKDVEAFLQGSGHLLDLAEVLNEEMLICEEIQEFVEDSMMPSFIAEWRNGDVESPPSTPTVETPAKSLPELQMEIPKVCFLYASPLAWTSRHGVRTMSQLDIAAELDSLRNVSGICAKVRVASVDALREALVSKAVPILHLSGHCSVQPTPTLFLEDEYSCAHAVTEDCLAQMGPWSRVPLLVCLACGSDVLVRKLVKSFGLRHAICCTAEVFDAAAKLFCRAFYQALGARHPVATCFAVAQSAVRSSATPGLRNEADKFLLVQGDTDTVLSQDSAAVFEGADASVERLRWPLWPRVEDYVPRGVEALRVAECFKQRRVVLLWGPQGIGKSALCREFCHHFSAPGGRVFSTGAAYLDRGALAPCCGSDLNRNSFLDTFAQVVLSELGSRGFLDASGSPSHSPTAAQVKSTNSPAWEVLRAAARRLDEAGRWLLVIDASELLPRNTTESGGYRNANFMVNALEALLSCSARLCLLLTMRRPEHRQWTVLGSVKVVWQELAPLPPQGSALLFARRVRRPLFASDFDVSAPGPESGAPPLALGRREAEGRGCVVLSKLAGCPLLHTLGGVPGRIIEAAAMVDATLPSLTEHPALPAAWRPSRPHDEDLVALQSAEAEAGEPPASPLKLVRQSSAPAQPATINSRSFS